MATFECTKCDKSYKHRSSLTTHQRIHDGMAFACDLCEKRCYQKSDLERHRAAHTFVTPYACDVDGCEKKFKAKNVMKSHKRTVHEKVPGKHQCEQCDHVCATPAKLGRHRRTHTGGRPYACTECAMKFAHKESLQRHHRSKHTLERYACDVDGCEKKFTQLSSMQTHKRTTHD